jgi:hypothetical protein
MNTSTMSNIAATVSTTNMITASSATTFSTPSAHVKKRDISQVSNHLRRRQALQLTDSSRKKRQSTLSYGGIEGLPLTFGVVLPQSCCTSEATLTSNTSGACMYHYIFFHQ